MPASPKYTERLSLDVTPRMAQELRELANARETTAASEFRAAVNEYLAKRKELVSA